MKSLILLSTIGLASCFLEDGREYVYKEDGIQTAGTMDFTPAAAGMSWTSTVRLQVGDDRVNVRVFDITYAKYNGPYPTDHSAWGNVSYENAAGYSYEFAVNYNKGKIVSIEVPPQHPVHVRNQIKALASNLQLSDESSEKSYFESMEKSLHGDCNIHYTVNQGFVTRSVSHFSDCANRPYRFIDNWRGWRCDGNHAMEASLMDGHLKEGRSNPEPIFSKSDSYYVLGMRDNKVVVEKMGTEAGIGAQFFEAEGSSHFVYTKRQLTLQEVKASDRSINPKGGEKLTELTFEMDNSYHWNKDRDLQASENYFGIGQVYNEPQSVYEQALLNTLSELQNSFGIHDATKEIEKAHEHGLNSALAVMIKLNYKSLTNVFNKLRADTSEEGVIRQNLFTEFLGSTGTTAAAMLVKDAIIEGMFDNGRDAARALTSIPYHIRRPNTQLVKELESLSAVDKYDTLKMALPLTIAHLVRRTCDLAGKHMGSQENRECLSQFSDQYADKYFDILSTSNDLNEKSLALSCLRNLKWGKVSDLLKPFIYNANNDDSLRASSIIAAMYGTFVKGNTAAYYLPIFMNMMNGPETRMNALMVISYGKFDTTQLSAIVTMLYAEQNFEIANFAYTLFEMYSKSISPCNAEKKELMSLFLRHMKQVGTHDTQYGIGISKIWAQEFEKEKYGYGGTNQMYVVGSGDSASPLKIGLSVQNTLYGRYMSEIIRVELRIEGVARAALKKFQELPEGDWKIDDLAKLLSGMGITTKKDSPVRVEVTLSLKSNVIIQRRYDESATEEGGSITDFLKDLQGATGGNSYSINHQRSITLGQGLYEQPTEVGFPMFFGSILTTMGSVQATIKKGLSRGVMFRDVSFDINLRTQGMNMIAFMDLGSSNMFEIKQDRVYGAQFPRKFVVGVNLIKKELKVQFSQPEADHPQLLMMHSQTSTGVIPMTKKGNGLQTHCPKCLDKYVLTKNNARSKLIHEETSKEMGSTTKLEYFDCELDLTDATVGPTIFNVFSPMNKNPKNFMSSLIMGLRQVRVFLTYFPKNEKCGAYSVFSQSAKNPVSEIEITIQGKMSDQESLYNYVGKKFLMKTLVVFKGEPSNRSYRFNFKYDFAPGATKNEIRAQFARQDNSDLGLPNYSVCFSADNQYPDLPDTMLIGDITEKLDLKGNMVIKYGETSSCGDATGSIKVDFNHETTLEAKESLKTTSYYQKCMNDISSPAWKNRNGIPITPSCWMTGIDSALARKYHWDIGFESTTPEVRSLLSVVENLFKTLLLPYVEHIPDTFKAVTSQNPTVKLDVEFKNRDSSCDVKLETEGGVSEFKDIPVKVNPVGGPLRNLRFDMFGPALVNSNLLHYCILTSSSLVSMDGSSFSYSPESCWSLVSGHCSDRPTYAVFTKKGTGLPLAAKIYAGGHKIEFNPTSSKTMKITLNDNALELKPKDEKTHTEGGSEIFKMYNIGETYVVTIQGTTILYDGNFVEVVPSLAIKGQHCGVCGNYDGNKKNELTDKNGNMITADQLASSWCK